MKRHCIHTLASTMASICLAISPSKAEPAPTLEPVMALPFRDNGVLQQKIQLPVWGTSLPGAKVTVSFDGKSAAATADAEGLWRVTLEPLTAVPLKSVNDSPAGKTMTVVCGKDGLQTTKEIRNLLVGDVWLCAGQSNMAGRMKTGKSAHHPKDSIEKADYPALRLLGEEKWLVCSAESAPAFGKVAFFFARRLQQDALIPVGLMLRAVGGSKIENWLNQPPDPKGQHFEQLIESLVGYGIRGAICIRVSPIKARAGPISQSSSRLSSGGARPGGRATFRSTSSSCRASASHRRTTPQAVTAGPRSGRHISRPSRSLTPGWRSPSTSAPRASTLPTNTTPACGWPGPSSTRNTD